MAVENMQIRRHPVSGPEKHNVSGNQLLSRYRLNFSTGQNLSLGRIEVLQSLQRSFRLVLLKKAQEGIEHNNDHYSQRIGELTHNCRNQCGRQKHKDHGIPKLTEKEHNGFLLFSGLEKIEADLLLAMPPFFSSQTGLGIGPQFRNN